MFDPDKVTSPWYDPEGFYKQYEYFIREFKKRERWANKHPETMNAKRKRELFYYQREALYHEEQWDKFLRFARDGNKPTPKAAETPLSRIRPKDLDEIHIQPLEQKEMDL